MTDVYTMHIETADGVKPHGFHLGTDERVARQFAIEALAREGVLSVALRFGARNTLIDIYDWRDAQPVKGA